MKWELILNPNPCNRPRDMSREKGDNNLNVWFFCDLEHIVDNSMFHEWQFKRDNWKYIKKKNNFFNCPKLNSESLCYSQYTPNCNRNVSNSEFPFVTHASSSIGISGPFPRGKKTSNVVGLHLLRWMKYELDVIEFNDILKEVRSSVFRSHFELPLLWTFCIVY